MCVRERERACPRVFVSGCVCLGDDEDGGCRGVYVCVFASVRAFVCVCVCACVLCVCVCVYARARALGLGIMG